MDKALASGDEDQQREALRMVSRALAANNMAMSLLLREVRQLTAEVQQLTADLACARVRPWWPW